MVAYYVPLVMIKVQPTEATMKERNARSEAFDDEMRNVVQTAYDDHAAMEDKDSYWPVRVNGEFQPIGLWSMNSVVWKMTHTLMVFTLTSDTCITGECKDH